MALRYFEDRDAGTSGGITAIPIVNVQGSNDITGVGVPAIQGYTDKTGYVFTVVAGNTGPVTLDVGPAPKPLLRNINQEIAPGQFVTDYIVVAQYNGAQDKFYWLNENTRVYYGNAIDSIATAANG